MTTNKHIIRIEPDADPIGTAYRKNFLPLLGVLEQLVIDTNASAPSYRAGINLCLSYTDDPIIGIGNAITILDGYGATFTVSELSLQRNTVRLEAFVGQIVRPFGSISPAVEIMFDHWLDLDKVFAHTDERLARIVIAYAAEHDIELPAPTQDADA